MRPLPRLLAPADAAVAARDDLGVRAAALAATGPALALIARLPGGTTDALHRLALRFAALVRPPMAALLVTGRADVALAAAADGVVLRAGDLPVREARRLLPGACLIRSVHSEAEASAAADDGADALLLGAIWPTATHPDRAPLGLEPLARVAALGVPTFAIGGVTPARARDAREAGAWGVAAIGALWLAHDPARAARAFLEQVA